LSDRRVLRALGFYGAGAATHAPRAFVHALGVRALVRVST
jgi:hypothetical protein